MDRAQLSVVAARFQDNVWVRPPASELEAATLSTVPVEELNPDWLDPDDPRFLRPAADRR